MTSKFDDKIKEGNEKHKKWQEIMLAEREMKIALHEFVKKKCVFIRVQTKSKAHATKKPFLFCTVAA